MPSKKTLAEAYWQYTIVREDKAMNDARDALHSAMLYDKYANEYQFSADFYLRRAKRLKRLAAKIAGRML